MSDEQIHYFLTFTTYGTWLHGDERGSVDRHTNTPGTPQVAANRIRRERAAARLRATPVIFTERQWSAVEAAMIDVCLFRHWPLHAINVRTNHVHVVLTTSGSGDKALGALKANATRVLIERGLSLPESPVWTRGGSVLRLFTAQDLERACEYVVEKQGRRLGHAPSSEPAAL